MVRHLSFVPVLLSFLLSNAGAHSVGQAVDTTSGTVTGTSAQTFQNVSLYAGIPFAQPPLGDLRWASPVAYKGSGAINATTLPKSCPFNLLTNEGANQAVSSSLDDLAGNSAVANLLAIAGIQDPQDEDCLYLNVWVPPTGSGESKKAVLVYIYGGGFQFGGSANKVYNGEYFAAHQDVILVSFNYRTNVFGFPGLPDATSASQNPGLEDQRLALEWVRDNIAKFGGDTDRITIFGESAGGASVDMYNYAYVDDPIIAGSICISGSATSFFDPVKLNNTADWFNMSSQLGCGGESVGAEQSLACLRNHTVADILNATILSNPLTAVLGVYQPTADNKTAFTDYAARGAAGKYIAKPLVTGNDNYEAGVFKFLGSTSPVQISDKNWDVFNLLVFTCPSMRAANVRLANSVPVWRYRYYGEFANTRLTVHPNSGAYHTSDLPVLFRTAEAVSGVNDTAEEAAIGAYMNKFWADFAKNPESGLVDTYGFQQFDPKEPTLIDFGVNNETKPWIVYPNNTDASCELITNVVNNLGGVNALLSNPQSFVAQHGNLTETLNGLVGIGDSNHADAPFGPPPIYTSSTSAAASSAPASTPPSYHSSAASGAPVGTDTSAVGTGTAPVATGTASISAGSSSYQSVSTGSTAVGASSASAGTYSASTASTPVGASLPASAYGAPAGTSSAPAGVDSSSVGAGIPVSSYGAPDGTSSAHASVDSSPVGASIPVSSYSAPASTSSAATSVSSSPVGASISVSSYGAPAGTSSAPAGVDSSSVGAGIPVSSYGAPASTSSAATSVSSSPVGASISVSSYGAPAGTSSASAGVESSPVSASIPGSTESVPTGSSSIQGGASIPFSSYSHPANTGGVPTSIGGNSVGTYKTPIGTGKVPTGTGSLPGGASIRVSSYTHPVNTSGISTGIGSSSVGTHSISISTGTSTTNPSSILGGASLPVGSLSLPIDASSLPTSIGSLSLPIDASSLPTSLGSLPVGSLSLPIDASSLPTSLGSLPVGSLSLPIDASSLPTSIGSLPVGSLSLPIDASSLPTSIGSLPVGSLSLPIDASSLPTSLGSLPVGSLSLPIDASSLPTSLGSLPVGSLSLPIGASSLPTSLGSLPVGTYSTPIGTGTVPTRAGSTAVSIRSSAVGTGSIPAGSGNIKTRPVGTGNAPVGTGSTKTRPVGTGAAPVGTGNTKTRAVGTGGAPVGTIGGRYSAATTTPIIPVTKPSSFTTMKSSSTIAEPVSPSSSYLDQVGYSMGTAASPPKNTY